ncbi:DUF2069 domain-containing protein [Vibrio hippocampi]|uniref:DUF2069 domain-containing protein n=1 Tax=Vibrio hippocampi TaxID=654686 RepID=A0ABN8DDZ4_9VIBR|nr:DUF2069 domain-containing protein [Vibrio hippocampi]CAH0524978.1 hypothetical protein VHP8226_00655 [Vibrio hippocampi]
MILNNVKYLRHLALWSHVALLAWVIIWHGYLSPHPHVNAVGMTIAWALPLLLPLPGMLKAKPYTHAWANFILMLYFLHGFTLLWVNEGERGLAAVELLLTTMSFVCNILYARTKGKELGLKLPRLSKVEKQEKATFEE